MRTVLHAEEAEDGGEACERRRHVEAPAPAEPQREQQRAKAKRHGRAERVAGVPHGHLGGQLLRMYPMREHLGARREAHPLSPAVHDPEHGKEDGERRAAEEKVHGCGKRKAERHEDASVQLVRPESVDEPAHSV